MAVYKVPQDVEADDKLIGPFSFRQFVYLIIVAIAGAIAWGLGTLFIPLAVIPLPVILLFGALALPLRKDQPMEIYLAAVVSFYLKPRKRLWQPDGIQSLVEITAPKTVEVQRTKNLSQTEAEQRLSYLANIVDTQGWAVRGIASAAPDSSLTSDAYFEAQQTEDILDESGATAQSFDTMISRSDEKRRQEMVARIKQTAAQPSAPSVPPPIPDPYATLAPSAPVSTEPEPNLTYNPYPTSIHQSIIQPLDQTTAAVPQPQAPQPAPSMPGATVPQSQPQTSTSETVVSPDIINLANNSDLSIETIAHEANRIHQKEKEKLPEDEVIISLR